MRRLYYGVDKDLGSSRKTLAAGHCQRIDRIKDRSSIADSADKCTCYSCCLRICSRNPDCIQPFDRCHLLSHAVNMWVCLVLISISENQTDTDSLVLSLHLYEFLKDAFFFDW